jgi:16S rRNA processing protein RimM
LAGSLGDKRDELIQIGKIIGAHGLYGALKVRSYADSNNVFQPQRQLFIIRPQGGRLVFRIQSVQPHGKTLLMTFYGIGERRQAEELIRSDLMIEKTSLPKLENDTYYWFELIGLDVVDSDGGYLGRIASIIQTGSNDVYVIRDPQKDESQELLIPAIDSVVLEIDLQQRIMRVELPEVV